MASGSFNINSGFTLVSAWGGQHYGGPMEVWPGGNFSGVYYAYTAGTEAYTFIIPSGFMPAGEGLTQLYWVVPNGHDGYGIQNAPFIESPTLGTLANPGIGAQSAIWQPGTLYNNAELAALSVRVRLQTWHGGVPNTFARTWNGWTLSWWSAPFPLAEPVTLNAVDIRKREARLQGTIDTNGYSAQWWFEYSLDPGGPYTLTPARSGGKPVNPTGVSEVVTGLDPGRLYYYRLALKNLSSGVTSYGSEQSFRTYAAGSHLIL